MSCNCSHCNCGDEFEDKFDALCGFLGIRLCWQCNGSSVIKNPLQNEYNRDSTPNYVACPVDICQDGFQVDSDYDKVVKRVDNERFGK